MAPHAISGNVVSCEPEILAYCAGVIDSDGCIGIRQSPKQTGHRSYIEFVSVQQVELSAIELLHQLFKGSKGLRTREPAQWVNIRTGRNGPRRQMYYWDCKAIIASNCLLAVRPYLRIKHHQADLALELRRLKDIHKTGRLGRGNHIPDSVASQKIQLYQEMRRLNGAGIHQLNFVGLTA